MNKYKVEARQRFLYWCHWIRFDGKSAEWHKTGKEDCYSSWNESLSEIITSNISCGTKLILGEQGETASLALFKPGPLNSLISTTYLGCLNRICKCTLTVS